MATKTAQVRIESDAHMGAMSRITVDDKPVAATRVEFVVSAGTEPPRLTIEQAADVLIEGRAETRFRVLIPVPWTADERSGHIWGEGDTLPDALEDAAEQIRRA